MSDLKDLKSRIKSVQNIIKVTNAMYLISASKISKLEIEEKKAKEFANKIKAILSEIKAMNTTSSRMNHDALLLVTFSPHRGLAGSLPTNLFKEIKKFTDHNRNKEIFIINIGKKLSKRISNTYPNLVADFGNISEKPTSVEIKTISQAIDEVQTKHNIPNLYFAYTYYFNALNQKPMVEQILPYDAEIEIKSMQSKFLLEPNATSIKTQLLELYIENMIYSKELESALSEHSARMVSMKSARDNATHLKDFLNIEYNKERQKIITEEIIEINSGAQIWQKEKSSKF